MELIRRFTREQYASALQEWAFLGLEGKQASFSSPFGDVFLEAADGWWFLDIMSGTLTREWASAAEMQAALNTVDGQDRYLMAGLVRAAADRGFAPGENQILAFKIPPMLGGPMTPDNLEVSDMVVTVDIHGQIHEQTRDLPPGTPIAGFTIAD
jgi:hypothetical protein